MASKRGYVDGQYGQIHYQEYGSGLPVIMHHQAPTDGSGFRRAGPIIAAAGYRAILVDMPGFGMSDGPEHPPSVEELADTSATVARHVGNDAVLLGHHTGAMIASEAIHRFSGLFRGLILYAPLIFSKDEITEWQSAVVARERSFELKADGSHYKDVWDYITGFVPEVRDLESIHWIVEAAVRAGGQYWYAHNACLNYDQEKTLRTLNESDWPALIITNSGDACSQMAARAVELCTNIKHIELEGGSIDFANEYPEIWAKPVIDFLD